MANSREKQARIRLAARARLAYRQLEQHATPARYRRFRALNRALALAALGAAARLMAREMSAAI